MTTQFMNALAAVLDSNAEYTTTANGARTLVSTGNACLDLFFLMGGMRRAVLSDIFPLVKAAYQEDPTLTLRILFYGRDVRQGLGERRFFRNAMVYLAMMEEKGALPVLAFVPEYGRWDDLWVLLQTPFKEAVITLVQKQLQEDLGNAAAGQPISLLGKWLPSINASSKETIFYAQLIRKALGMDQRAYRKTLAKLRSYSNVLEPCLVKKDYTFSYSQVPGRAFLKYRRAFLRHDEARFAAYMSSLEEGKETVHTGTLYPYDIVSALVRPSVKHNVDEAQDANVMMLETLWKKLPPLKGKAKTLVVLDTSGSMLDWCGRSTYLDIGISLAIFTSQYLAEPFRNSFMTFSSEPRLLRMPEASLLEKIRFVYDHSIVENTDVQKAMALILQAAVEYDLKSEDMPTQICIISDMEFDEAVEGSTNFEAMKAAFQKAGYTLPTLVFWNLHSAARHVPVGQHESNVALVSGMSAGVFDTIIQGEVDPVKQMLSIVESERYQPIQAGQ